MSEVSGESSGESGGILDWALVDSHGDLEDGETSSTTSSVEVMAEQEEEPSSNPLAGSPTGPKFVLRLASREHLGPDSDEESAGSSKMAGESASFDIIPSQSTQDQETVLHSPSPPDSTASSTSLRDDSVPQKPRFTQQISREHIEDLVQAITEVQSSVSLTEGYRVSQDGSGSQEAAIVDENSLILPTERLKSHIDCDTESVDSSVSSRFSFLTRETGNGADFEEPEPEIYGTESLLVGESVGTQETMTGQDKGTTTVLFRSPVPPFQEESGDGNTGEIVTPKRPGDDRIIKTIKRIDRMFNISVVIVLGVLFMNYYFGFYYISGVGTCKQAKDRDQYVLRTEKIEVTEKISLLQDAVKNKEEQINMIQHQHLVQQNRLEKSLEKCKVNLNDAEQENSDLRSEVIRLKYSMHHVEETVKQEPDMAKIASGDTPYIQCPPGKVMKRHHEVDGDTMYFCDWDKNQEPPTEEKVPAKAVDSDVLAVEGFCEKIMDSEDREISKEYKRLRKVLLPSCRKALKLERLENPDFNQQPVEDDIIPCQSCYQKLSQVENNWITAVNEKEAALSRSELWKDLYTKAIEREVEREAEEEKQELNNENEGGEEVIQEPVSLQSCWKFVVANLTAGNHLFESFGLYWEEVENLMPANFSSLFDFWINSKWRKAPEDDYWQEEHKDDKEDNQGPWTGSDTGDEGGKQEGQFDWGDTVNSVLNKTRESVTTVNKQIHDTWKQDQQPALLHSLIRIFTDHVRSQTGKRTDPPVHLYEVSSLQVKNMSKHLWKQHEPTIVKMHNSFSEKISKLGEKFQEKLRKKTEHWFRKSKKRDDQEAENQDTDDEHYWPDIKDKKQQEKKIKKMEAKKEKLQRRAERKEVKQEKLEKKKAAQQEKAERRMAAQQEKAVRRQAAQAVKAGGRSGGTRRRPHLDVGGTGGDLLVEEEEGYGSKHQEVPTIFVNYDNSRHDIDCDISFEKLRKAANNLKWRAKNIDSWSNLVEEYRVIGERLMMYDMYQLEQEEGMSSDQRIWYDCQRTWWSNNLQNKLIDYPAHCKNQLEKFQVERKVVDPREWWNKRISDAGESEKDPCFYKKMEITYSILQYKLDLFRINMCRHRIPPCSFREHLYMNEEELRELFQESEFGLKPSERDGQQKNWLFQRAEQRKDLREKSDDGENVDYNDYYDDYDGGDDDDDDETEIEDEDETEDSNLKKRIADYNDF